MSPDIKTKQTLTRCFSCDARMTTGEKFLAHTKDGQKVYVGTECHGKIQASRSDGYQPPKGGPRLWVGWEHHFDCGHGSKNTPEDKTAELISSAWQQYLYLFQVPPHGTLEQLRAMLCLKGGKEVVTAVNAYDAQREMIRELVAALRFRVEAFENYPPGGMSKGEYLTIQQVISKAEKIL